MSALDLALPLRWSDLDAQNHVNNVTYLQYLQEARVALLLDGAGADMMRDGVVVVSHQIEYLRPIEYSHEPVIVRTVVTDVGAATFAYAYEICHDGQLCARARTVCCPYDFAQGRPRRLTDAERDALRAMGQDDAGDGGGVAELTGSGRVDTTPFREIPRGRVGQTPHVYELAVRWSDQDWFRHVNNVLFCDFFQEARIRMLDVDEVPRHLWLMARQDVAYKLPMDYRRAPYYVRGSCVRAGTTSMTLVADVVSSLEPDARVHATSTCVLVCADLAGVPTDIPQVYRDRLAQFPAGA